MPNKEWIQKIAGLPFGRIGTVCLWGSGVLGLLLLMEGLKSLVHGVLLGVVFITLVLCHTAWQHKAARVAARVLALLPVAALVVLCGVDGVLSALDGVAVLVLLQPACIVGLPVLCWSMPALATLRNRGGRYDVWVLRVVGLLLLALIAVASFTAICPTLVWRWDLPLLRYVWLLLTAVAWLLTWVPAGSKKAEPKLRP